MPTTRFDAFLSRFDSAETDAILARHATLRLRFDAGEAAVIARSLDYVEQKITEVLYAETRALKYVPLIAGIDPGAKTYTFAVMDKVGRAAVASERGKDLPRADVSLSENTSGIKPYGAAYGYTTQELREITFAALRGLSLQLDTARAKVAAEMIARKTDAVVAFGDPDDPRITGFLNHPSVTVDAALGPWSGLTADQLLTELFDLANTQVTVSRELFFPDTILLPTAQWLQIQRTPLGTAGVETVIGFFKKAMEASERRVEIAGWPLLDTAGAGGVSRAVSYKRDVEVAGAIVPLAFAAQAPEQRGLEWVVSCECVCGGTAVKQPLGMIYKDGI